MKVSLYILRHGDPERDLYKVGIATDVARRIDELQTGNPFPIDLIRYVEFPSRWEAYRVERCIHSLLEEVRAQGEWFHGPLSYIEATIDLALIDTPYERGAA